MRNKLNNLIRKIKLNKIKEFKKIDGFLSENEAIGLFDLSKSLSKNSNILEIGSWKGKSTLCLAKGLKKGFVYIIDPFNADGESESKDIYLNTIGKLSLEQQFKINLERSNLFNKIKVCKGYSADFIDLSVQFSLIFIDGDHSIEGCEFDFLNFNKKLSKSGYLVFHDYYPERLQLGPTYVINKYILNNENWQVLKIIDSLFIAKKI